ncbi:hypothetical protein SCAR479_09594 [Seiridium cardinale]|uniref:Uncharacterized protein n=1 Tax=Seiridium cardinale TaxID=138064 RepID=A0ABR2XIJ9_9PEZI
MLSRTNHMSRQRALPGQFQLMPFVRQQSHAIPASTRFISSKGETIGGTKTDHTKEFDNPSHNQKSGQRAQAAKDTESQGGSQGSKQSGSHQSQSGAEGNGGKQQETGQHVGPMGSS